MNCIAKLESSNGLLNILQLLRADIAVVSALTFPAFRPHLADCLSNIGDTEPQFVAMVARMDKTPVGLLLVQLPLSAEFNQDSSSVPKTAKLLSISVLAAWRGQGIAKCLMLAMENTLRDMGCLAIATAYTTLMLSLQPFERLLATCQWTFPTARLLMSKGYCKEVLKAPCINAMRAFPDDFEVFEWSQLTAPERSQLEHCVAHGLIPVELSPFTEVQDIEPAISIGMRHRGEVVAWMILTRSPLLVDALCYRSLFVKPHLRMMHGLGPALLVQAMQRHAASALVETRPVGVFGISLKSSAKMVNFFKKRLAPHCFSTYESRESYQLL